MPEHALTGFLITFINSIVILHTCDFESVGEDATNHFLILVSKKKIIRHKKKKGLSHKPACIRMWTHFCRIALHAKPNFFFFFFFFLLGLIH